MAQASDGGSVVRRHVVLERRMAAGRAQAGRLERVLDRHRHTVEQPPQIAPRERGVRILGAAASAGFVQRADGVQRRVMARDAREMELDQLARRDAARAHGGGELRSAGEGVDRHAGILARRKSGSEPHLNRALTPISVQCSVRTKVRPRSTSFALGRSNMKSRRATAISL